MSGTDGSEGLNAGVVTAKVDGHPSPLAYTPGDAANGVEPPTDDSPGRPHVRTLVAVRAIHERLRQSRPGFIPRRALFYNYWLFQEQEFHFVDGKLLLRGKNTTGKTTVLASILPLLFDADKRAQRLDPFGDGSRKLVGYLIGKPDDTADRPTFHRKRTGYIALELEHGTTGRYVTLCLGLKGIRHEKSEPKLDWWGFVLDDGRRLGPEGIRLWERGHKEPLDKAELRRRLGNNVRLCEHNDDYAADVNRALFGFESLGDFHGLMETLTLLRSPKLNKDTKPPAVAAMLDDSLPPVDPEVLGKATGTIERIDDAERLRQDTMAKLRAAETLHELQEECIRLAAQATGFELVDAVRELGKLEKNLSDAEQAGVEVQKKLHEVQSALHAAQAKINADRSQKEELQNNPAYRELSAQVRESEHMAQQASDRYQAALKRADYDAAVSRDAVDATASARTQYADALAAGDDAAEALEHTARAARWPMTTRFTAATHATITALREAALDELEDHAGLPDLSGLTALRAAWDTRKNAIKALIVVLDAIETAEREVEKREAHRQERDEQFREALEREQSAGEGLVSAAMGAGAAVAEWAALVAGGVVTAVDVEAATQALSRQAHVAMRTEDSSEVDMGVVEDVQHDLTVPLQRYDDRLTADEDVARTEAGEFRRELQRTEAELQKLQEERDIVPPSRPGRAEHRARLDALGINALPLYQACDVAPDLEVADAIRLEQALEESGILDALVPLDADSATRLNALAASEAIAASMDGESAVGDHWLAPGRPVAGRSLAAALFAVHGQGDTSLITPILASVGWPEATGRVEWKGTTDAEVAANGLWIVGPLAGVAHDDGRDAPRYLGVENRRRARASAIERLERLRDKLEEEYLEADRKLNAVKAERRQLTDARRALGKLTCWGLLRQASETLRFERQQFVRARKELEAADQAVRNAHAALLAKRLAHRQAVQAVPDLDGADRQVARDAQNAGENAIVAAASAVRAVEGLRGTLEALRSALKRQRSSASHLGEALETLNQAAADAAELTARRDRLREELARGEVADVIMQIQRLTENIDQLDKAVRSLEREIGGLMTAAKTSAESVVMFQSSMRDSRLVVQRAHERFVESLQRYKAPTFQTHLAAAKASREAAVDTAKLFLQRRRERNAADTRDNIGKDARGATSALGRAYSDHRAVLIEFSPQQTTDGDVYFRLGHRPAMAYEMVTHLTAMRDEQSRIIQENETELYERFIRQDLLSAIRTCILKARDYADSVNGRMAECPIPGTQYLSLTWKPRRERLRREAKSDRAAGLEKLVSGIRFSRLVELLDHDVAFLSASDQEELRSIFKELITQVRQVAAQEGSTVSLQDGLATIMDYRSWFEFRLQYHEGTPNERPPARDLSTTVYQLGSGAQKAMYVMVPLLAALETKLQGARQGLNAPRFFGIDEAFAGIDAEHTATLFALMESMRYSWVMTSPVLWASARELPGSATYDFTLEGSLVGTDLFVWDGTRRLSDADNWEDP